MKTVLAFVPDGGAASTLETALLVTRRFGSHLVGLHAVVPETVLPFAGDMMAVPLSSDFHERIGHAEEHRQAARRLFHEFVAVRSVPMETGGSGDPEPGPSAAWREEAIPRSGVIGAWGRVFDLIVVVRPAEPAGAADTVLEDALFESCRPVLMAPPSPPATVGERVVVIAWNGSTETAVAVAHARPFLVGVADVRVISVDTGLVPGAPSGEELARNLVRHGVRATARHVTIKAAAGGVWLEVCRAAKADLLIKGAYTMSRLRQMVFGGPTRQIILEAELPVLLGR